MRKHTIKAAAFLLLIATLGSCVKGDKGDAGPAGAAGTSGTNGTNGTNGNANVVSGIANIATTDWLWDATSSTDYVTVTDDQITSAIVSAGTVSVFQQVGSSWTGMPYDYFNSTVLNTWGFQYGLNSVTITYQRSDLVNTNPGAGTYKIVAITASQRMAHPNTNWKDYNQIQAALGSNLIETKLQAH